MKKTENADVKIHNRGNSEGIEHKGTVSVRILAVSQYFYPETFRINDIASEWVKRGYKVTVLTGIPNYPEGKFFEGYDYCHCRKETWNGVKIIRIPLIPRGSSSVSLAANYLSFAASGWLWKTISRVKADLVFTFEVSPMTQALIGCWYAHKHHIPHFLYVQDLWPDNVMSVTGVHNPLLLKPIDHMVDYIYKHSNQIFTASRSFAKAIAGRNVKVDKKKIHYWPQYAEQFYKAVKREDARRAARTDISLPVHLIPDDNAFYIAFTGNIGTAQGLDILAKTAQKLKKSCSRIVRFVIIGNGRYQKILEDEIKQRNVRDMFIMIPRQPPEAIPDILCCCDAAFLSFNKMNLWKMTIPAKLQSYMACGMPVIAAVQGEAAGIIKEAECGVCSPVGDSDSLAASIKGIMASDLKWMGRNSRKYYNRHFDKSILMDSMDEYIALELELQR